MAEVRATPGVGRPAARDIWGPGAASGVVGAVAMGLIWMIVSAARGLGFWMPMKLISATFVGADAILGGAGSIVLGVVVHLIVGASFGIIFAALLRRGVTPAAELLLALLYSTVVFFVMTYLVLPWANEVMYLAVNKGWFFLYHLVYGAGLALVLPMRRAIHGRTRLPASATSGGEYHSPSRPY